LGAIDLFYIREYYPNKPEQFYNPPMDPFDKKAKPLRDIKHISETASGKLFNFLMPDNWLVRSVTERDYGIDYYVEIVDENDELTGKLISIQLKSRQSVSWTQKDTFAVSDIKLTTTNLWNEFAVPVFVFLADLDAKEVYYLSVKSYIRKHYIEYSKQRGLTYHFDKTVKIATPPDIPALVEAYDMDIARPRFESVLFTFWSSLTPYADFIMEHDNRDFHLGLEDDEAIFIEAILNNYLFLANYFKMDTYLPSIHQLKKQSRRKYGNRYYDLVEGALTDIAEELQQMTFKLLKAAEKLIEKESQYWIVANLPLVNFINNYNSSYLFR